MERFAEKQASAQYFGKSNRFGVPAPKPGAIPNFAKPGYSAGVFSDVVKYVVKGYFRPEKGRSQEEKVIVPQGFPIFGFFDRGWSENHSPIKGCCQLCYTRLFIGESGWGFLPRFAHFQIKIHPDNQIRKGETNTKPGQTRGRINVRGRGENEVPFEPQKNFEVTETGIAFLAVAPPKKPTRDSCISAPHECMITIFPGKAAENYGGQKSPKSVTH